MRNIFMLAVAATVFSALVAVPVGAQDTRERFEASDDEKSVAPGVMFTINNACGFESKLHAMDLVCLIDMGSWTAGHSVQAGKMDDGENVLVGVCGDSSGVGLVQFVPFPGMSTEAVNVHPKSGDVVNIPENLCVAP